MLAIGEYDHFEEKSKKGVELFNYYYPDWKSRNKYTYYQNQTIFDYLVEEIGMDYPWSNYKQVPVKDFSAWSHGEYIGYHFWRFLLRG